VGSTPTLPTIILHPSTLSKGHRFESYRGHHLPNTINQRRKKMIEYTVKVHSNGSKYWYLNGQRHREDGPAVEGTDGSKYWYLNGQLHREDGPAVEWRAGSKYWYLNGQLHREDGPAVEHSNGDKSWYLNGNYYTEKEYNLKMNPVPVIKELSVSEISQLLGYEIKVVK